MIKKLNTGTTPIRMVWLAALVAFCLAACKKSESTVEVISNDLTKPGVVTDVHVDNFNGGATITYKLPDSKNLLYVLARYAINDSRTRETKSSYYTDTITVDGFAREKDYEVTLYAVSRANVMSDPVTVTVHPQTPNYLLINDNLEISPDFGGANFYGFNPNRVPVAVHVISLNETTSKYDEQEPEYISNDTVNVSVRGYDAKPTKFGVFVTDRFGNTSDTVFKTLTPLYETLLDKSKFFTYHLASDGTIGYGWELRYFFDGSLNDPGWHTVSSPTRQGTFGIGQTAKISRLVLWNRLPTPYAYQNPRMFSIWGSNKDNPQDSSLPDNAPEGAVAGDWINMGNFVYPNPPSGLPANQANAADVAFAAAGVNFKMPLAAPEVKYIRFVCTQTWGGLDYVNAMEISFYGNPL